MNVILNQNQIYYYEDKPYRILHEGKVKTESIVIKLAKLQNWGEPNGEQTIEMKKDLEKNNSKWLDVVIYEPLYETSDFKVCVKEKEDFYNNYKTK